MRLASIIWNFLLNPLHTGCDLFCVGDKFKEEIDVLTLSTPIISCSTVLCNRPQLIRWAAVRGARSASTPPMRRRQRLACFAGQENSPSTSSSAHSGGENAQKWWQIVLYLNFLPQFAVKAEKLERPEPEMEDSICGIQKYCTYLQYYYQMC